MESSELLKGVFEVGSPDPARLSLNQITINHQTLEEAVDLCVKQDIKWIAPWRNRIQEIGVTRAARLLRESGLRVSSLCRGGFFPAATSVQRLERVNDNRKAVDEAAEIGAPLLVLVCGGAPDRDIDGARQMVADGIAALEPYARERGIRLGIEPLHPMFAADRSVIVTLSQALDLALRFDAATVGIVVDVFHVWWDPELHSQIKRAAGRIFGFHISDWAVPLPGILASRSMLGDGVIELRRIRAAVESVGYRGPIEVEILNEQIWSAPPEETLPTVKARYREFA
jgi:sugar phosphate isomerase/epimerase